MPAQQAISQITTRNKKCILLHHTLTADWNPYMFLLSVSGTGSANGDCLLAINGTSAIDAKGSCYYHSLFGNLDARVSIKFEQKSDKSVHIYLVSNNQEPMLGYRLTKIPFCIGNENTPLEEIASINVDSLKDANVI